MLTAKVRAALVILLTLILGMLAGIGLDRSLLRPPRTPLDPRKASARFAKVLEDRLDLSADQKQRVEAILRIHAAENEKLFRETRPRIRALMAKTNHEIEGVLTPPQRTEFEKYLHERDIKRRRAR